MPRETQAQRINLVQTSWTRYRKLSSMVDNSKETILSSWFPGLISIRHPCPCNEGQIRKHCTGPHQSAPSTSTSHLCFELTARQAKKTCVGHASIDLSATVPRTPQSDRPVATLISHSNPAPKPKPPPQPTNKDCQINPKLVGLTVLSGEPRPEMPQVSAHLLVLLGS